VLTTRYQSPHPLDEPCPQGLWMKVVGGLWNGLQLGRLDGQ